VNQWHEKQKLDLVEGGFFDGVAQSIQVSEHCILQHFQKFI